MGSRKSQVRECQGASCVCSHGHRMRARGPVSQDLKLFNLSSHLQAGGTMTRKCRVTPVAGSKQSFTPTHGHLGNGGGFTCM